MKRRWRLAVIVCLLALTLAPATRASASTSPTSSASFVLDRVRLTVTTQFLPSAAVTTSNPGDANQVASSVSRFPYRELEVIAVPIGTRPPAEDLPVAVKGADASYRTALTKARMAHGGRVQSGPPVTICRAVVRPEPLLASAFRIRDRSFHVCAGGRGVLRRASAAGCRPHSAYGATDRASVRRSAHRGAGPRLAARKP